MAEETINTRIVANADFSALIADVHRVTASLSKLQEQLANSNKMLANQIAVMNRSFSDTLRSTGQYSTHFVSLQSDVEKFGKNLDGGKLKLNQYFNTFRDHAKTSGGLIRDLAKQQVALQNSILQPLGRNAQGLMQFNVHVPRGLDEIKNKTAIARQELQIMNKVIQDGAGQLINWGKNTQWAGRQLTVGLTVPLVAFGAQAAKAFREADQELVRLTKVYGDVAGTSADELSRVRDEVSKTAKEISSAMGVSFKETIGLAADIAATGKTGDELLGSIKETTRLAVLGEVDRQDAMKATLAIQSAFKQNTEELSESINFLNAVENQTSTTLNDLVEAIPKAGPVVKGLGGSVKDLALYLTAMREGGINAAEGANALKSALASLINPTDVAVGKFQSLGIDLLSIVNDNAGNLTGTLIELQSALDRLNPLQKQQAIEQLFGKFQFSRLNALFENLGREGSQTLQVLDLMKASTSELASVADRELSAVTESASGKYRRAIESLRASLAEVGEQFLTINTVLIQVIDKIVQFANNLPGPVKQILALAGGITAIIGPVIMLTGVLANFFGYLLKGAFHMKAFLKGGEGWKYLTPEMLAAEKAGKLVEQSFYSDAKAAAVLKQALGNLIDEFSILEAKAKAGALSVNPAVSTMAGNLVMAAGGSRVVDPNHPLAGTQGTRASSHMVPRSGMTEPQRLQQTMFGMVPGSIPVNQKIGQNPQIYMNEPLPNVPGLTMVNKVSTGIVSSEAARWHTMMATLGMQSKAEIENLKRTIAATGTVSKEFMMQFDDILPHVNVLTNNAAKESALIVAELRAGKINLDAARAKIVALNLETERLIAATVQAQATAMGRTINPTMVPTLNQPVVDPTGKSNMRELFKKGRTRDFINKVAGTLGVRTSGAGYNIETTIPKKFAMGGVEIKKYANGYTSLNAALQAAKMLRAFSKRSTQIGGVKLASRRSPRTGAEATAGESYGEMYKRKSAIYSDPEYQAYGITPTQKLPGADNEFLVHGMVPGFLKRTKGLEQQGSGPILNQNEYGKYALNLTKATSQHKSLQILPTQFIKNRQGFNDQLRAGSATAADFRPVQGSDMVSLLLFLKSQGVKPAAAKQLADRAADVLNQKIAAYPGPMNEAAFGKLLNNASVRAIASGFRPSMVPIHNPLGSDAHSRYGGLTRAKYAGGVTKLPGYGGGDIVPALLEPGESVITKTGTKGNEGTLHLINAGYNVDNMVGFKKGVVDVNANNINSGMASSFGGMGLMAAGQMVGGTAGQIMNFGGMAMSMAPLLSFLPKLPTALTATVGPFAKMSAVVTRASGSLTGLTKVFNLILKPMSLILRAINPLTLGLTILGTGIKLYVDNQKKIEEQNRITRLSFGMTSDAAKKAGYTYTDYNKTVKDSIANLKAVAERNKMIYETMTQAGTPFKMTIEQYKKLKETVKDTMQDYIKLFDSTKPSNMGQVAVQLKAQFMAAGDSVEEATAKIYTLISLSNKAGMAGITIGSSAFKGIKNVQDAAEATIKTFNAAVKVSDAKGQVDALLSAFTALDAATNKVVSDSKKNTKDSATETITEYDAAIQVVEKINGKLGKQKNITSEMIVELSKMNPVLGQILSTSDTVATSFQKIKLLSSGINLDVSLLSGSATEAAAKIASAVQSAVRNNAVVKSQSSAYQTLQDQITSAMNSQKGMSAKQQIDSRKVIENLNEQIKKIKDASDAKIKALRNQSQAENDSLELQKLQLDYQEAIARGDQDAAARAQISMQQFTNQVQSKKAEEAIISKAELEIKPLQDQIDKLGKKNQDLADKASLAGDKLSYLQKKAGLLSDNFTVYTSNLDNLAFKVRTLGASFKESPEYKEAMVALRDASKKLGISADPESVLNDIVSKIKNINTDLINVYLSGGGKAASFGQGGTSDNPRSLGTTSRALNSWSNPFSYGPSGVREMVKSDAKNAGVLPGEYFTLKDSKGKEYKFKVREDGNITMVTDPYTSKALGGPVTPGRKYLVNDRINSLGNQQEVFMPTVPGLIKPNINTAFNIPSQQPVRMPNISNSPNSNNTYNIDIELNGTTVTADDVMRALEAKMRRVGATLGRPINVGGNY
jgi:TP901 family phage tail tape measure protein